MSTDLLSKPEVPRAAAQPVLDVRGLTTTFATPRGPVRAVDNVSFSIAEGECLGLIGESGSGKSVTALSLSRLVPSPPATVTGQVLLDGRDILTLSEKEMSGVRGNDIGFIFQDPMACLNPALTLGYQIAEPARLHLGMSKKEAAGHAMHLMDLVGIPRPAERLKDYPHQFSGGMRQRVMIAIALAANPRLIIADEPTTALDVSIQAQILDLIRTVSAESGASVLMITHDLGIAAGLCDRINVMYAGQIVESSSTDDLFYDASMPYAWGLLDSLPRIDDTRDMRLRSIPGTPPVLTPGAAACRFAPRCPYARDECRSAEPALVAREGGGEHLARCFGTEEGGWLK